jgi:two-component system sensor histidine kinase GlrK
MKIYHPPTILHLTLLGYFVVLLPLIAAIVRGASSLDESSQRHRDNIAEVVAMTRLTETLSQELLDLERVARQYQVLRQDTLFEVLRSRLTDSSVTIQQLDRLTQDLSGVSPVLQNMNTNLLAMDKAFAEPKPSEQLVRRELDRFENLSDLQTRLKTLLQENFTQRVANAKRSAERTRTELLVLGLALLPGTLVLVGVFSGLITRPIRQVKQAIQRLGEGHYEERFALQGPRDLQALATQLNWLGDRLNAAESEKRRFLRHISHELKTPLSSLKEGVELLKDEVPGPLNPNQREVVGIIADGVESFQELIDNLLDYNLMRREPSVCPDWYSLSEIVRDILQPHRLTAERKRISIAYDGADISVYLDRSVLKAALDNLISNAIHYTPEDGHVAVRWWVDKQDGQVSIEVQDSGPGIPEADRDRVFLPFYQGKVKKSGPLKGTGLGLSVAKECVESLQGKIRILDTQVGALFHMDLPVLARKDARS